jgi:hypothetical protein
VIARPGRGTARKYQWVTALLKLNVAALVAWTQNTARMHGYEYDYESTNATRRRVLAGRRRAVVWSPAYCRTVPALTNDSTTTTRRDVRWAGSRASGLASRSPCIPLSLETRWCFLLLFRLPWIFLQMGLLFHTSIPQVLDPLGVLLIYYIV